MPAEHPLKRSGRFAGEFTKTRINGVQNLFGKQDLEPIKFKGDFKPESLPVFPYLRAKSFPVSELDQSEWGIVPFTPNHEMPWFGYVRNTLIPSVLLLLAAMFWDTRNLKDY